MADLGQLRVRINIDDAGAKQTLTQLKQNTITAQAQFKAFSATIDRSSKSMKDMKDQAKQLEQIVSQQNSIVDASKKAWDEAAKKYGETSGKAHALEQQYYKNIVAMEQTRKQLDNLNQKMKDTPNFADKLGGAISKTGDGLKTFGGKLEALGSKFAPMTKALVGLTAGAVGLGVAFVGSALKDITDFQTGMNKVFTLMPNITKEQMGKMSDDVKKFALDMNILPEEALPALYDALSAGGGITKDNVFEYLTVAQKTAIGGVTDLGTALNGITSVVNAYGSGVLSVGKASDIMFTASALGKTDIKELSESLFNVIPTAAALGVKFEDIGAAMGSMTAQGIPTSVATTQLRQLLVELSKSGSKAADVFKKVSGKSFKEFIASGGDVNKALEIMNKAAKNSHLQLSDMFSSVEAGNAALSLFDNKGYIDGLDAMNHSAGATEKAYNTMNTGIQKSLDKIKSQFAVFKLKVAETFAPIVEKYLVQLNDKIKSTDWNKVISSGTKLFKQVMIPLGDAIRKVIDFFKGLDSNTIKWIATIGLASTVIAPVTKIIGGLSGALGSVVSIGGTVVKKIAGAGGILSVLSSIASPVGIAVAAAVAIGGIALAFKSWHDESMKMKEVDLSRHDSMQKQYEDTAVMIDQLEKLRGKSKLTNDEFIRYVDLQKKASTETDVKTIEGYQKQMDELQRKSGMSNTELQTMVDRNKDIANNLPNATTAITSQGEKIVGTTDSLKKYNDELLKMSTIELESQFFNSLSNQKTLGKDLVDQQNQLNESKQNQLDLETLLSAESQEGFKIKQDSLKAELDSITEQQVNLQKYHMDITDEQRRRAEFLQKVVHLDKDDKSELIDQIKATTGRNDELTKQINKTKEQQAQFLSISDQMIAQYLTTQNITKEQAIQAVQNHDSIGVLDRRIEALKKTRDQMYEHTSLVGQTTQGFQTQVALIDQQIAGFETTKQKITDTIGLAGEYNTELGKDVQKTVTTNTFVDDIFKTLKDEVTKPVGTKTKLDKDYEKLSDPVKKVISFVFEGLKSLVGYATGTDFHPGGLAMAGEKGYELAQVGNKFAMLTAGVYDLPRGTKVYTHEETKAILKGDFAGMRDMASAIMPTRNNLSIPTSAPSTTNNTTNWSPSIVVHGSSDAQAQARTIRRALRRAAFEGGIR